MTNLSIKCLFYAWLNNLNTRLRNDTGYTIFLLDITPFFEK